MNSIHYAALEQAIDDWMERHCERADWPNTVIGKQTVQFMATAARAVFDACEESQDHAVAEGYFRDTLSSTK